MQMSTAATKPVETQSEEAQPCEAGPAKRERLVEHVADWRAQEVTVDAGAGVIGNVALVGLVSKNGYRYAEQTLREAAPLYEGKPVFLDHADDPARPQQRSTRDLAGVVVRPRFADGRLRADISTNNTDAGRTLLGLAEKQQPAVGMSHVVLAERNGDGTVVERIHEVVSVDAVVFPATTTTFHEQAAAAARTCSAAEGPSCSPALCRGGTCDPSPPARTQFGGMEGCLPACHAAGQSAGATQRDVQDAGVAVAEESSGQGAAGIVGLEVLIEEVRQLRTEVAALLRAGEAQQRQSRCAAPCSREREADVDPLADHRRAEEAIVEAVRGRPAGVLGVS